jgi:predicted permease
MLAGFALGLAVRGRLQRHFATVFRITTAAGVAVVAFLAGWSFEGHAEGIVALGVLLGAQVAVVSLGAWLFRASRDGPLLSFALYGNPGFWSVPITGAIFGARAAVVLAAYDMLTQPRVMAALRFMRARAPTPQRARTGLVDYSPTVAAMAGLALGRTAVAPQAVADAVVALASAMSVVGALLVGVAWPTGRWLAVPERRVAVRLLALHLTFVPAVLLMASLAGVHIPAGAWVLALGPLPVSSLSLARLFGYSARLAACALAISMASAVALLPAATWLGHRAG